MLLRTNKTKIVSFIIPKVKDREELKHKPVLLLLNLNFRSYGTWTQQILMFRMQQRAIKCWVTGSPCLKELLNFQKYTYLYEGCQLRFSQRINEKFIEQIPNAVLEYCGKCNCDWIVNHLWKGNICWHID